MFYVPPFFHIIFLICLERGKWQNDKTIRDIIEEK